ncbi:hypothetical protein, partial [Aggregatibacter aphrophilus]|uniref:hypothetical protein n=1 Tax=Aggregatibacter aphrophilus TaxID=732 RepID=UPI0028EFAD1B
MNFSSRMFWDSIMVWFKIKVRLFFEIFSLYKAVSVYEANDKKQGRIVAPNPHRAPTPPTPGRQEKKKNQKTPHRFFKENSYLIG